MKEDKRIMPVSARLPEVRIKDKVYRQYARECRFLDSTEARAIAKQLSIAFKIASEATE